MRKFIKRVTENPIFIKYVNRETVLYIVFGVLTTIVNYFAFYIFDNAFDNTNFLGKYGYLLANILAWIVAVVFAFITNKIYVFESKNWKPAIAAVEFLGFVGARLFSLLVEMGFMWLLVSRLGMNKYLAKLIVSIVVMILNYVFSKLLVFKKKNDGEGLPEVKKNI